MIKILHLADLHLDSPFGSLKAAEAHKKRMDMRNTFSKAIDYGSENGCKAVLISGDLFDSEFYSKETLDFLNENFKNHPECQFVISPGNHDPYTKTGAYGLCRFPSNVHVFDSEDIDFIEFPELNLKVYGYAFKSAVYTKRAIAGYVVNDNKCFNVLCAHADTEAKNSNYAPITEEDFENSCFDYCALGHIHTKPEIMKKGHTVYAYSGCLGGRDFTEYGEKGGIIVTLDKIGSEKTVDVKRITFCPWQYGTLETDISECEDNSEIAGLILKKIENLPKTTPEYILKISLTGNVKFVPDTEIIAKMADNTFIKKIEDNSFLVPDFASLEKDFTVRGEFYRRLKPLIFGSDSKKRKIAVKALIYGLRAIDGNDII